jgi:predicted transglutaminase-like cysteine proteinase
VTSSPATRDAIHQLPVSLSVLLGLCLLLHFGLQTVANVSLIAVSPAVLTEVEDRFGRGAKRRIERWQELVFELQGETPEKQLKKVNSFFNRVRYKTDQQHWNSEDYWATPIELLSTNGGDCEDYAIAKYFTLRALGIPDEHLRITYVNAIEIGQAHMVLTYYGDNRINPLVLDNLKPWIQQASERRDLIPVYGFNGGGLWDSRERANGVLVGTPDILDHWSTLLGRLPPGYLEFENQQVQLATAGAG